MYRIALVIVALLLVCLGGCSDLGYYFQCVRGQLEINAKRRPISAVLSDPATSESTRQQLDKAREVRRFASRDLGLPDNNSYYEYADLGRDFVLWNVVATPEFSLEPVTWCFPVAGCVPYRGYYQQHDAQAFAAGLAQQGRDTWVYGVPAYSTLNWFSDPVLNTFSHYPETALAGLIFHELAHQKVYLPGHADFNEAFAETIEREGVLRWLEQKADNARVDDYLLHLEREEHFLDLTAKTRNALLKLYSSGQRPAVMREHKARILAEFQTNLKSYMSQFKLTGFAVWLGQDLNNAHFASLSTYRKLVPAFQNLLALHQGDLPRFYQEVQRIAELDDAERSAVLQHLLATRIARITPAALTSPPTP